MLNSYLLDKISDSLPTINKNWFELAPLNNQQAIEAIINPSMLSGSFLSSSFEYNQNAIDKILDFLTKSESQKIESFQLQILCNALERKVIKENKEKISENDLSNLEDIYKNYYEDQISLIEPIEDRQKVRILMEEGLIFDEEERRLSLFEGQIGSQYSVTEELLRRLEDTHLIRRESSSKGGYTYELSHDSLVNPILIAKKKRLTIEDERKQQEVYKQKVEKEQERKKADEARKLAAADKRKKRMYMILFLLSGIAAIGALGLGYWALQQRALAEQNAEFARKVGNLAKERQKQAETAKEEAEVARIKTEENLKRAQQAEQETQKLIREVQRQAEIAEKLKKEALIEKEKALEAELETRIQKDSVQFINAVVADERDLAKKAQKEAEKQTIIAENQTKESEQNANLLNAIMLSEKVNFIDDIVARALVVLQAFDIYKSNNGKPYESSIYTSLFKVLTELDPPSNKFATKHHGRVRDVSIYGDTLFSIGDDGRILMHDIHTPPKEAKELYSHNYTNRVIKFSPNKNYFVVGGNASYLLLFETHNLKSPDSIYLHEGKICWDIEFLDNNSFISLGENRKFVQYSINNRTKRVFDISSKGDVRKFDIREQTNIDYLENGQINTISIDKPNNSKIFMECSNCTDFQYSYPEEKYLITGKMNGEVDLMNIDPKLSKTLINNNLEIIDLTLNESKSFIGTTARDYTVITYLKERSSNSFVIRDKLTWNTTSAFYEDQKIVLGNNYGEIRVWPLEGNEIKLLICGNVKNSDFSIELWNKYIGTSKFKDNLCY